MFGRFTLLVAFCASLTFVVSLGVMRSYGDEFYMLSFFGFAVVATLLCLAGLCVLDTLALHRSEAATDAERLYRLLDARLPPAGSQGATGRDRAPVSPAQPVTNPWDTSNGRGAA